VDLRGDRAYRAYVDAAADTTTALYLMRWVHDKLNMSGWRVESRRIYLHAQAVEKEAWVAWNAYGSLR
jgi:hypothetical protein